MKRIQIFVEREERRWFDFWSKPDLTFSIHLSGDSKGEDQVVYPEEADLKLISARLRKMADKIDEIQC